MPTTGEMLFSEYEADLRYRESAPGTIKKFREVSASFGRYCDPMTATRQDVRAWLQSTGWAASSQRSAYACIRAAYSYGVVEGLIESSPCVSIKLPPVRVKEPGILTVAEISGMEAATRNAYDTLLLRMFTHTGMRTCEVSRATWEDVDNDTLLIHGKGRRERTIPIHPKLRQALREAPVRSPWLVYNTQTGGRLAEPGVDYRLRRFLPPGYTPHDTRATFARDLRVRGAAHIVVQWLLGHNPKDVTDRHYDWVSPDEMREAVLTLYVGEPRRSGRAGR